MRAAILAVFLFVGCKGTDLAPDEFRLDYTRGWADNNFEHRNVDFATDSDAVTVGFSWYLGESASERESQRQADQLTRLTNLLADVQMRAAEKPPPTIEVHIEPAKEPDSKPAPTPPAPEPEKKDEKPKEVVLTDIIGDAKDYLLYAAGALLLAIAAFIKRKTIVEGCVTLKRKVQERGRDRAAVKRRLQEGAPPKKDEAS